MDNLKHISTFLSNLNALVGALFIVSAFGITAVRQVRIGLRFFVFQSFFLATSAFFLGLNPVVIHLLEISAICFVSKVILLPLILTRFLGEEVYTKREINQVINIPTSLIISVILTLIAFIFSTPVLNSIKLNFSSCRINIPIGMSVLLIGAFTIAVRREAVPQFLGLLQMENGAFFAGIVIAPDLPMIAELILTFDLLVLTFVIGVLVHSVKTKTGTTLVGEFTKLKEGSTK